MLARLRLLTAVLAVALLTPACLAAAQTAPDFRNYPGPRELVGDAGEPSIGYNPKTDAVLFQAYLSTAKVDFSRTPPAWTDVTDPSAFISLDPILFTDRPTGRTIASQLLLACSQSSFSDDDGGSWLPSQGCGIGTAVDHQTVGGGPYHAGPLGPLPANPLYPNPIYYCAQAVATATCARSDTGGATYGEGHPLYTAAQCAGLHGHVKVAPDGTAYVPNFDCDDGAGNARPAAVTTKDNGLTWSPDVIPDGATQDKSDPHIGIGDKGTVCFGYQGARGKDLSTDAYYSYEEAPAMIAVKRAGSDTWSPSVDVGAALGVKNIEFPEVFAGDDDRAAFAFLGTTTAGDDQSPDFKGVWHLYVAFTYDAGQTWTTVDATPNDAVQRGCIWLQGGDSDCRNLLDFNDITMDKQGRVLIAYADGCTGECVTNAASDQKDTLGVIARQEAGKGLLAAFDPAEVPVVTDPGTGTSTTTTPTGTTPTATTPVTPITGATGGATDDSSGSGAQGPQPAPATPQVTHPYTQQPAAQRESSEERREEGCERTPKGFRSVRVRARRHGRIRVSFKRSLRAKVSIDVLKLGKRTTRVVRLRGLGVEHARTVKLRRNGRYAVLFSIRTKGERNDVRQVTLTRRGKRIRVGKARSIGSQCEEEKERERR